MKLPGVSQPSRLLATNLVSRLRAAGFAAFWVGGCVRDQLLGREPLDYDIATDARPEQVEALFARTIPVGKQFGVVVVVLEGQTFQVATFRSETDYRDGRRPGKVEFASAQADAARRDFTVNGLFYDPLAQTLHDWVGGAADLRAKIIRTIGPPGDRFEEDHLRLLRAVRFAAQLGFEVEPRTLAAIRERAPRLGRISAERIRDELLKLLAPPHAARGWLLLRESGLLEVALPELAATVTCEQPPEYHPEGSVFNHVTAMLRQLPDHADPGLVWSVLLHDIAKPVTARRDPLTGRLHFYGHDIIGARMAETLLRRLRFDNRTIAAVVTAVRHHMQFHEAPRMRRATLRRLLLRPGITRELELHRLDCLGSSGNLATHQFLAAELAALERQPSLRPPLLKGDDLIRLGMPPGKAMGGLLAEIREKQLAGELTSARAARVWARKAIANAGGGAARLKSRARQRAVGPRDPAPPPG